MLARLRLIGDSGTNANGVQSSSLGWDGPGFPQDTFRHDVPNAEGVASVKSRRAASRLRRNSFIVGWVGPIDDLGSLAGASNPRLDDVTPLAYQRGLRNRAGR